MVVVAQLVRASDCDSEGRGFEPHHPPQTEFLYYIYILYSPVSDLYYVGYTNDYERRLNQHNESSKNTYTSKHRLWIIAAVFECGNNKADAIRLERFIKRQKSRILLLKLIDSDNLKLAGILAQLIRVPKISG